jgi:ABC-type branched-subunit amino acid transport system ATPase component
MKPEAIYPEAAWLATTIHSFLVLATLSIAFFALLPNSSGKTTFFNLVSGLIPISSGVISFKAHDVSPKS